MSPMQSTISVITACICGRHDSTVASKPSSSIRIIPLKGHFRKDHIPISLPKLQPVSDTVWRKKVGFKQIVSIIYSLLNSHSVDNLIPLISREVPIKTFISQQEVTKVMHKVRCCVFNVNHLQVIMFLNTDGNTVNFNSDKLNDRPGRLTIFWFRCEINCIYIDSRIRQKHSTCSSAFAFPNTITISP